MKTTKNDYEYFKSQCLIWIEKFGIGGWEISFSLDKLEDRIAQTEPDVWNRKATITLATELPKSALEKDQLSKTACHEALHLLLADLTEPLVVYFSASHVNKLEHEAIMHLLKGFGFGTYEV